MLLWQWNGKVSLRSSFHNRFLCEVFACRYLDVDWLAYTLHTQFYYLGIIFKSLVTRKYFIPRFRFLKALSCRALDWPEFISVGMLLDKFNSLWVNGRQNLSQLFVLFAFSEFAFYFLPPHGIYFRKHWVRSTV